jgi:hypothetical protein
VSYRPNIQYVDNSLIYLPRANSRHLAVFISSLQHGSCVVQPTEIAFSSGELVDMILRCGLNRLNQIPTFLCTHLRNARLDPKLLSMLRNLDEVWYGGLPLPREEEEWAYRNGINLRVRSTIVTSNCFDSNFLYCRMCLGVQNAELC